MRLTGITRLVVAVAAAGLACPVAGCAEESEPLLGACGAEGCVDDCPEPPLENCDIRKRACQKAIFRAVRCVRGVSGKMPPVRVMSVEEYQERLEDRLDPPEDGGVSEDAGIEDGGPPDSGDASSDVEPQEPEPDHWSVALSLLGLLPPVSTAAEESVAYSVATTAAFYSPGERMVTLIDRDRPDNDDSATIKLAHEFVHALQDQEVGFGEFYDYGSTLTDAWISRQCLVEGEAELYADLAWAHLHDVPVTDLYWSVNGEWDVKYARRAVVKSDAPYVSAYSILAYAVGENYLRELWLAEGSRGVLALYGSPPLSSIYWMNGYRENLEREAHWQLPLACEDAAPPDGFELHTINRLGPFIVFAFMGVVFRDGDPYPTETAWEEARHWRGDFISVFTNPDSGATALSWRIRFDDEQAPRRFRKSINNGRSDLPLRALVSGDEIEILAGDDSAVLEEWRGTDPDACPEDSEPEE